MPSIILYGYILFYLQTTIASGHTKCPCVIFAREVWHNTFVRTLKFAGKDLKLSIVVVVVCPP